MFELYEIQSPESSVLGIRKNGADLGQVPYYLNPCHLAHAYIEFSSGVFLDIVDAELIRELTAYFRKPLQIMVSSRETSVARKLRSLGFECKRRCFEVIARRGDYLGNSSGAVEVRYSDKGSDTFQHCSNLMLHRYIETHRDISPWTGSPNDFFNALPAKVAYEKRDQHIINFAFIEDGEIAYVFGKELDSFKNFAETLIVAMFENTDELLFEADDNDLYAMTLKNLFTIQNEDSWNTYVFPFKETSN